MQIHDAVNVAPSQNIIIDDHANCIYRIDPNTNCVVCLAAKCDSILECSHQFHRKCIDAWITRHKNCPVCRATAKFVKCK
jgi:hypothetical protein